MKTLTEIREWCAGAAIEFDDPSQTTGQIFARFSMGDSADDEILVALTEHGDGFMLQLKLQQGNWLPIPVDADGMLVDQDTGQLARFGLEQVCPGIWTIDPSLNMPGVIHAFVVIYGVPSPAPWERRIILPHEFAAQTGRRF